MPQILTDDELVRAKRAFRAQLLRPALRHRAEIDARTLTVLQRVGLMSSPRPVTVGDLPADVVSDPEHADRAKVPAGPMVYHVIRGEKVEHAVAEITDALLDGKSVMRAAALHYLQQVGPVAGSLITTKTRLIMEARKVDLISEEPDRYRKAAVVLVDALRDDFLFNLAGLRQSMITRFDEAAVKYGKRVFEPSVSSIESLEFSIWHPRSQRADIEKLLVSVGNRGSIQEVCGEFYVHLGHIPLDRSLSLAVPLRQLFSRSPELESQAWKSVWRWADGTSSPLARYHACLLFIELPHLVPSEHRRRLWAEVTQIIAFVPNPPTVTGWAAQLMRRSILARHYLQYFSTRLPSSHSERLTVCAWWLAERVEGVMVLGAELANTLTELIVQPATHWSGVAAEVSHPRAEPSDFAYATQFMESPWSLALQCQLFGRLHDVLDDGSKTALATAPGVTPETGATEDHPVFGNAVGAALAGSLVAVFPLRAREPQERVFGFDVSVRPIVKEWMSVLPKSKNKELLVAFLAAVEKVSDSANLLEQMRNIAGANVADQILVFGTLRSMVYAGTAPLDELWKQLLDQTWRENVLLGIDARAAELLFESLIEIQVQKGDAWRSNVPHFLAIACEGSTDDDRRRLLFSYTLLNCIAVDSDSALRRLLTGPKRQSLVKDIEFWRNQFNQALPNVSAWVRSKVRAAMAVLHVT